MDESDSLGVLAPDAAENCVALLSRQEEESGVEKRAPDVTSSVGLGGMEETRVRKMRGDRICELELRLQSRKGKPRVKKQLARMP